MKTLRVTRHYIRTPFVLLGILEWLLFAGALHLGSVLRWSAADGPTPDISLLQTAVFASVLVLIMLAMGLYQRQLRETASGILLRIGIGCLLGTVVWVVGVFLVPALDVGRIVLGLSMGLAFAVAAIVHIAFYKALDTVDQSALKHRVLVVGAGERASTINQLRRRADQRGFLIVGYVSVPGEPVVVDPARVHALNRPLAELAETLKADEVVVALDERRKHFPVDDLLDCRVRGLLVMDLLTFFEREVGKVRLDMMNPSWMIFSDGFRRDGLRNVVKRSFDVLASLSMLALVWPLMGLTALAIWLETGAPILYRQQRVGEGDRAFNVLKFRSMTVDAEKDGKARWASVNDQRVTRVGSVIRKTRLDELPQLFNILRGDMSLVGPRPERPEFVQDLERKIPFYHYRHRLKPGLTGWAQLNYPYGASERDALEKLKYDLYYVKNHSLLLDLTILLQTLEVVMFGNGAR